MAKIIAIHGLMGHGKDTLGIMLAKELKSVSANQEKYPSIIKGSFGLKVKRCTELITGEEMKEVPGYGIFSNKVLDFTREQKQKHLPRFGMTLGSFMQKFATEGCRDSVHKDIWTISIDIPESEESIIIITDLRFFNEIGFLDEKSAVKIKIVRSDIDLADGRDKSHESEQGLPRELFDFNISNKGSLEDLSVMVELLAVQIIRKWSQ